MQVRLSNGLFALSILASIALCVVVILSWGTIQDARSPESESAELFAFHLTFVIGVGIITLIAYGLSFHGRRKRRPFLLITAAAFALGLPGAALTREALVAFGFMIDGKPAPDLVFFGAIVGIGFVLLMMAILFEVINRALWSALARNFDAKENSSLALTCNRISLLFNPGQQGMLRSVALTRFRQGARGEAVETLRSLYEAGHRDPDILECLCKDANERGDREAYLVYLTDLFNAVPTEVVLRDSLFEELFSQKKSDEALALLDRTKELHRSEDVMEKQCRLLMVKHDFEAAVDIAEQISKKESIPFRRSQKLLREVLSHEPMQVSALNILAMQADRMALREQKLRWLEKSYEADSKQGEVRNALLDIYRDLGNQGAMEPLLRDYLRENPRDRESIVELAQVLHHNEKSSEALELLMPFSKRKDGTALSYYTEALIQYDQRNYEESRHALQMAKEARPDEETKKKLATLSAKIERAVLTAEVAQALEQAHEHPENLSLQLQAMDRLVTGGHADKVVRLTDEILSRHPGARYEVLMRLEKCAARPDTAFAILNLYSDLLAAEGRYEDALQVVETMASRSIDKISTLRDGSAKILRRSPHHLPTLRKLGDVYNENGKYTDMIHSYALYLAHGGEETEEIDRALAKAYISLGDYENARRFVTQLLSINPKDVNLLKQVIPLAVSNGQVEDAAEFLKKLEAEAPTDPEFRKLKEEVTSGLGARRFGFLKREFESGKGTAETLEQLGDVARGMENFNDAITYYQRAARDPEDSSRARRCTAKLALSYMHKRLDDLASETLRDITISLDDDPKELAIIMDILYEIGTMFHELKHYTKAERVFKQLCKIDAGYRDVLQKVESLRG